MKYNSYARYVGKGVGLVRDYHKHSHDGHASPDYRLYYYKKGNFQCGKRVSLEEIENSNEISLNLYPNPAKNTVKFELNDNYALKRLSLFNSIGEEKKVEYTKTGTKYVINTS